MRLPDFRSGKALAFAVATAVLAIPPAFAQSPPPSPAIRPVAPPAAAMPPPGPAPTPRPPTPVSSSQGWLEGLWTGQGYQSIKQAGRAPGTDDYESNWSIALTVERDEFKIDYPSLGCGGHWIKRSASDREMVFTESITYGRERCLDLGTIKLGLVSRGALSFTFEATAGGSYFVATGTLNRPSQKVAQPLKPDDVAEIGFWESVRASRDPDELRAYLRKYPEGRYAELARLWLDKLAPKKPDPIAMVAYGRYHALVIGNNEYLFLKPLKTALNDARVMARLLGEQYGFDVTLLQNATRYDILKALTGYRAKLGPGDNLLIYYAGHGMLDQAANEGYWQPVDAEPDIPANWIANGDLTTALKAMTAKHVMIIADSCYSGTLTRAGITLGKPRESGGERQEWLRRTAEKRARTALTSGGLEPVEDGGGGSHSIFAKMLMGALSENIDVLDAQSLALSLKRLVAVNAPQTPEYADIRQAGHEGGDFLFVRRNR
jgi:uncharacterized caspase-like protein